MRAPEEGNAVVRSCPVTPEWLQQRYAAEQTGESYEQWLEGAARRMAVALYEGIADEGLTSDDAHAEFRRVFPPK